MYRWYQRAANREEHGVREVTWPAKQIMDICKLYNGNKCGWALSNVATHEAWGRALSNQSGMGVKSTELKVKFNMRWHGGWPYYYCYYDYYTRPCI